MGIGDKRMETRVQWFFILSIALLLTSCGSTNQSDSSGESGKITLTIQNPDSNASGSAKAVPVSNFSQAKGLPASSSISECTLTASGPSSASTSVEIPNGAAQVEASLSVPIGDGYKICAECLDGGGTTNNVGVGFKGCTSNVTVNGSTSVTINALFLNLASRNSGDARYVRIKQDSDSQLQVVAGFNGTLTDAQKTTAQCNIEIDTSLAGQSPSTVDAGQSNGLVTGTKGRPYFILGPGLIVPSCFEYNTSGTKILKCTGSWGTDSNGNTIMKGTLGVRQGETIVVGRNARLAASCTKDGSNYVAIPSSGMAEFNTSKGGDKDVASLIDNGSTCSISRNGETCNSGLCAGSGKCGAVPAPTLAADVSNVAGCSSGACAAGSANGTATNAQFNSPSGGCITQDGNTLYVMDSSNNLIRKIDFTVATTSSSYVTTFAGSAGSSGNTDGACTNAITNPYQCVVRGNDTLFFTGDTNPMIRKVTLSSCQISTVAGSTTTGFVNATGTAARFNRPQGIDVGGNGTLYVADRDNHAIRKITSEGVVTTLAGGCQGTNDGTGTAACLDTPTSVALDATGTILYIADASNKVVRSVNTITQVVSTTLSDKVLFTSIVIDPTNNNIYATRGSNIRKAVIPTATLSTLAGSDTTGATNGNGTAATFNIPAGIEISVEGDTLYIFDTQNNKIRKIQ